MRVIVSGGGTGGHFYPALAIGKKYRELGADVLYVGSSHGIESGLADSIGFDHVLLPVEGMRGKNPLLLVRGAMHLLRADALALHLIKDWQPDLIIGTGGYGSFPVLKAGIKQGVKTVIHEANAEMGRANLQLAAKVDCICLTYAETERQIKNAKRILLTGMIMRESIDTASREAGAEYLDVPADKLLVTVSGGSQGSRHINDAMAAFYAQMENRDDLLFYHIVGKNNGDEAEALGRYKNVRTTLYEDRMELVLARTDLCVGRAGASFLAEISCRGIPAVLVPYPYSHGHQEKNAASFAARGAALNVLDSELPQGLHSALLTLINDAAQRQTMAENMKACAKTDALQRIVDLGFALVADGK